jgi:DNA-directed RNA polymerase
VKNNTGSTSECDQGQEEKKSKKPPSPRGSRASPSPPAQKKASDYKFEIVALEKKLSESRDAASNYKLAVKAAHTYIRLYYPKRVSLLGPLFSLIPTQNRPSKNKKN